MIINATSPWAVIDAPQSLVSSPSSYITTDNFSGFDPEELTRLLRPRACKPDQYEMIARYKAAAKRDHDRLIAMGGRPTRPVRLQPTWKAVYKGGLIHIIGNEGDLECTLSDDIDPMHHHWSTESELFQGELAQWQSFRNHQQTLQHLDRLETELELDSTDSALSCVLTTLSDWQEFETFQIQIFLDALNLQDRRRRNFLQITERERIAEDPSTSSAAHYGIGPWLRLLDRSQEVLEAARNQLNWIKDQWPKVVAECIDCISRTPRLQSMLEAKFRKQTHATFNAILQPGGRPSHSISPPDNSMDDLQRVLHWISETSKYREDLLDWKAFLNWRRLNTDDKFTMQRQGYQCPQFRSALNFSTEFEHFRRSQHDHASTWVKCWQRISRWYEEDDGMPDPYFSCDLEGYAEAAHANVRDSEQKLAEAATRLEQARQEHARAFSEHVESINGETREEPPPTPPLSVSVFPPSTRSSAPSSSPPPVPQSPSSPPSLQSPKPPRSPRSPKHPPHNEIPSSKKNLAEKRHRRSKKENARKEGAKGNANTTQQPLPPYPLVSHQSKKDDNIQMADISQDPKQANTTTEEFSRSEPEPEDTVMTNTDEPPHPTPPSPSEPPTKNPHSKHPPPSSPRAPPSRKTPKPDHAPSNKVSKNKIGKKPHKKIVPFTEQQAARLLNAASIATSIPLRRSERLREKAAAMNGGSGV